MVRRRPNTQAVRIAHATLPLEALWQRVGDVWAEEYLAVEFRLCNIMAPQTRVRRMMAHWQPEGWVVERLPDCRYCAWCRFETRHCIEALREARERVHWAGGDSLTAVTVVQDVRPSSGFRLSEGVERDEG